MVRSRGNKLTDWTDLDQVLLDTVNAHSRVIEGLRSFSRDTGVSLDSTRNRWYSKKLKELRGEEDGVDQRITNGKFIGRKTGGGVLKPRKKRKDAIDESKTIDKVKNDIVVEAHSNNEQVTPEIEYLSPDLPFVQLQIDNAITVEAKDAINDIRDSLVFFNDGINRLIQSNSDLVRDNENTKSEYNRLLKSYKELEETYSFMLRMLNQARVQALQEEDKKTGINNVSNVSSKYYNTNLG